jgi:hypothetical protein
MDNAHYALLIAETHRKNATRVTSDSWKTLALNWQQALSPTEEKYRLTENVWLICLDDGLPVLADLVQAMKQFGVPLRVLFLEEVPAWIQYPPDAPPAAESKSS